MVCIDNNGMIKQYFWGTETNTDRKERSAINCKEPGRQQDTKTKDLFWKLKRKKFETQLLEFVLGKRTQP